LHAENLAIDDFGVKHLVTLLKSTNGCHKTAHPVTNQLAASQGQSKLKPPAQRHFNPSRSALILMRAG
jgi:hypothetical protein